VVNVSYQVTESEYAAADLGTGWVAQLVTVLGGNLTWLQQLLTASNYETLVLLVMDEVTKRLDVILSTKKFNQLGGLQLDRDVRQLVSFAGELTARPMRDKFGDINQKATILSLESVEEILDYWGPDGGPFNWRLSGEEVRNVLRQRVDFSVDRIEALVL
jgi:conserved oligomeric Golgi complex subunit 4